MKNEDRVNRRRAIWKFQLTAMDVPMPFDAEICTFQYQAGVPCIWAIVDPDVMSTTRRFRIFGTGHELPAAEECYYVGTAQEGQFVWHLFELL
jgi:hypothetical protein